MIYFIATVVILFVDQIVKNRVALYILQGDRIELIRGFIRLTHVQNYGAAFSMMQNMRWILLGVTGAFMIGLVVVIFKGDIITSPLEKWCAAFIAGGATGNAIDRILTGYVIDMFEFEFVNFAIFNVADCFIVLGGTLFIILTVLSFIKERKLKIGD